MKLDRDFYARDTVTVAREMLGKYLVMGDKIGRIVETEAYLGPTDLASHARHRSRTRNYLMFGQPGILYVYLTYGLHYLANIIAKSPNQEAGAVLLRALEPVQGITLPTNGPARLTKALGINLTHKGMDLVSPNFYLDDRGDTINSDLVIATPRIGIDYAGQYRNKPWRFYLKDSKWVSRK